MRYSYIPASNAAHEATIAPPARKPYPEPEIHGRHPQGPHEAAKGAIDLGKLATGRGWAARLTYSRGHVAHMGTGEPARHVETCLLALEDGPRQGMAIWYRDREQWGKLTGWESETAWMWRSDQPGFPQRINVTTLRMLITGELDA